MLPSRTCSPAAGLVIALLAAVLFPVPVAYAVQTTFPSPEGKSGPVQRFGLLVGSNDGGGDRVRLRFAQSDARAMGRVLGLLGGMQPEDRVVLLEPRRVELLAAFADLGRRVQAGHAAHHRTEVIFYYSGHADDLGLLPGGERVSYGELRGAINGLGADVRIAILDSCSAGAFTRRKGGAPRPPFLVDDSVQVRGHAYIASSSANEAAQESDRILGSFFTHYFVTGLRGGADASGDGRVTLNEAYAFAFKETLAGTEATRAGAQHPAYDIEMAGTGDIVLTDLHVGAGALRLPGDVGGRLFVRDGDGALVAELGKSEGGTIDLGLDPGRYRVSIQRGGALYQGDVDVMEGRVTVLALASMRRSGLELTRRRGSEVEEGEVPRVPFNVSLFHPVSMNGVFGGRARNWFSFSLVMGYSYGLEGFGLGAAVDVVNGDTTGVLIDGALGYVGGDLRGLDISGAASIVRGGTLGLVISGALHFSGRGFAGLSVAGEGNVVSGGATGVLIGGATNVVVGTGRGLEVAGAANVQVGDMVGAQVATMNLSGDLVGVQIGVVNVARKVKGLQLGLVNVAESAEDGVPLGLVNVVRHGGLHSVDVAMTDAAPLQLMLKLGVPHLFGIVGAGLDPLRQETGWSHSLGLGTLHRFGPIFVEGDALVTFVQPDLHTYDDRSRVVGELRLLVGWQPIAQIALFIGPSLHLSGTPHGADSLSLLASTEKQWTSADREVRLGPGFVVGVRAF